MAALVEDGQVDDAVQNIMRGVPWVASRNGQGGIEPGRLWRREHGRCAGRIARWRGRLEAGEGNGVVINSGEMRWAKGLWEAGCVMRGRGD